MGDKHCVDIKPALHGGNTRRPWSHTDSAWYCWFDPDHRSCCGYERNYERKNQGRDHERKRLYTCRKRSVQAIASSYFGWSRYHSSYGDYPVLFWTGTG